MCMYVLYMYVPQMGRTAVMRAVEEGYSDIVTVLLEAGANTNIHDSVSAQFKVKCSCCL